MKGHRGVRTESLTTASGLIGTTPLLHDGSGNWRPSPGCATIVGQSSRGSHTRGGRPILHRSRGRGRILWRGIGASVRRLGRPEGGWSPPGPAPCTDRLERRCRCPGFPPRRRRGSRNEIFGVIWSEPHQVSSASLKCIESRCYRSRLRCRRPEPPRRVDLPLPSLLL